MEPYTQLFIEDLIAFVKGDSALLAKWDCRAFLYLLVKGRGKTPANLLDAYDWVRAACAALPIEDLRAQLEMDTLILEKKYLAMPAGKRPKHFKSYLRKYLPMYLKDYILDYSKQIPNDIPISEEVQEPPEIESFSIHDALFKNDKSQVFQGVTQPEANILWLTYGEDLSIRDIADRISADKGTVNKYLRSAIDKITMNLRR